MLNIKLGLKDEEVTDGWRKFHHKELHNIYTSPNIIRTSKSRMRRVGNVARTV
jgi:hypothetical protein